MAASKELATQMLARAAQSPRCQHIRYNNHRCGAPARRDSNYCVFHAIDYDAVMPASGVPEDAATVQIEIARVIRALQNGVMEPRAAGLILYGLQLASQNLRLLGEQMPSLEDAANAFPEKETDLAFFLYVRLKPSPEREYETEQMCKALAKFVRGKDEPAAKPETGISPSLP